MTSGPVREEVGAAAATSAERLLMAIAILGPMTCGFLSPAALVAGLVGAGRPPRIGPLFAVAVNLPGFFPCCLAYQTAIRREPREAIQQCDFDLVWRIFTAAVLLNGLTLLAVWRSASRRSQKPR